MTDERDHDGPTLEEDPREDEPSAQGSVWGGAALPSGQILRQGLALVGIALGIALATLVVLWGNTPAYAILYSALPSAELAEVLDSLQAAGIPVQVTRETGAVMVETGRLEEARARLAQADLPKTANAGFELLQRDQPFGASQLLEEARYQYAIEGELARTITRLRAVKAARVHLAIPKRSPFLREQKGPSASVVLEIHPGRNLDADQAEAIARMVAFSIPDLTVANVSIVDQAGRLLTAREADPTLRLSEQRLRYVRELEGGYAKRIVDLVLPIVGPDGVRAQIAADVDFSARDETHETFRPDPAASGAPSEPGERRTADTRTAAAGQVAAPKAGDSPTLTPALTPPAAAAQRGYEGDRTVSHVQHVPGTVRRLSVAVLIKNRKVPDRDHPGQTIMGPSVEDLDHIDALVKEAIGFNASRGDTVRVSAADFSVETLLVAEPPERPWWERPWIWDGIKQAFAGLVVLIIALGLVRPLLRALLRREATTTDHQGRAWDRRGPGAPSGEARQSPRRREAGGDHAAQAQIDRARAVVDRDERQAARILRGWLGGD